MARHYPVDAMTGNIMSIATAINRVRHIDSFTFDSDELPDPVDILDELVVPQRVHGSTIARAVWPLEPSMLQGLFFTLVGAEDSTANVLVGSFIPLPISLRGENPNSVVQYIPRVDSVLALTAGARTGVSGGIIGTSDRYVDTISVTTAYRFKEDPLRIHGPKDGSGDLSPDDTPATYFPDVLGGAYGFCYCEGGTATGIKIFNYAV